MTSEQMIDGVTHEALDRHAAHERVRLPPFGVEVGEDEHEPFAGHGGGIGIDG